MSYKKTSHDFRIRSLSTNKAFKNFLLQFENFLKAHLKSFSVHSFKGQRQLKSAMEYSLFSGGKRFRPLLVFATAQIMKIKTSVVLPWAGALEMIHTASLIHDDLPSMDNSPFRRGQATTHRRFGEAMALLAGDCLWVEAFRLISKSPKESAKWLSLLCAGVGFNGLMGGQALDLKAPLKPSKNYYKKMHSMKTGALISVSINGVLALKPKSQADHLKKAGALIGQAFQISDDLQDEKEETQVSNLAQTLGPKKAKKDLLALSNKALGLIESYSQDPSTRFLKELVIFNRERAS